MQEELASLGTKISEQDYSAIILGSLPKSYDHFLSVVTATASILKRDLDPEDLMQTVIDEFDCCSMRPNNQKGKDGDVAFYVGGSNNQSGKTWKKTDKDVEKTAGC